MRGGETLHPAGEKDERRFEKRDLCSRVPRLRFRARCSRRVEPRGVEGLWGENTTSTNTFTRFRTKFIREDELKSCLILSTFLRTTR